MPLVNTIVSEVEGVVGVLFFSPQQNIWLWAFPGREGPRSGLVLDPFHYASKGLPKGIFVSFGDDAERGGSELIRRSLL